ncbi:ankyrin repeat domain-containing protein [Candidatus Odyssella thessalonicensis]|uniref:ankyrin repeat domain-containing protein n=1 Tax=Candidatus Odyssella thessalonicensis TaxID=84647 RepID=UPI000225AC1B|nr:ankyrin repeat domain-containing protein [Candidatus Odyssella thessalonicensis]
MAPVLSRFNQKEQPERPLPPLPTAQSDGSSSSFNREQTQPRIAPALPRFNQKEQPERPLPPVPAPQGPGISSPLNKEQIQPRVASLVSKFNQNVQPERPLPPLPASQSPSLSPSVNIKEAQAKISPLWSLPNQNRPQSNQNTGSTPSSGEQARPNLASGPQNAEKSQPTIGKTPAKGANAKLQYSDFSLTLEENRAQMQEREKALQMFDNRAYFEVAKKFEVLSPIHQYYLMRDLENKIDQEVDKLPPHISEEQEQILRQASQAYKSVLDTGLGQQKMDAYVSRLQPIYYLLFQLQKYAIEQQRLRDAEKADKGYSFMMGAARDAFESKDSLSFAGYISKMSVRSQMSLFHDLLERALQKTILKNTFAALEAKDYESFVDYYSQLKNKQDSNMVGNWNHNCLTLAAQNGQLKALQYILSQKEAPSGWVEGKNDSSANSLHFAVMNGHLECAQYLVAQRYSIASIAKDWRGKKLSPLELATDFLYGSITKGDSENIRKGCQLVRWVLEELRKNDDTNDPAYLYEYVDKWKEALEDLRALQERLSRKTQEEENLRLVTEAIYQFIAEREQQANYIKFKQEQEKKKRKAEKPSRAYARA